MNNRPLQRVLKYIWTIPVILSMLAAIIPALQISAAAYTSYDSLTGSDTHHSTTFTAPDFVAQEWECTTTNYCYQIEVTIAQDAGTGYVWVELDSVKGNGWEPNLDALAQSNSYFGPLLSLVLLLQRYLRSQRLCY